MKYFSLKVICEDYDAIKHGQTYVVGKHMLQSATAGACILQSFQLLGCATTSLLILANAVSLIFRFGNSIAHHNSVLAEQHLGCISCCAECV